MKALESIGQVIANDYVEFARFNTFKGKLYRVTIKAIPIFACLIGIPMALFGLIFRQYPYAILAFVLLFSAYSLMSSFKNKGKRMFVANARFAGATHHVVFGKNGFINEVTFKDGTTDHNEYYFEETMKIYYAPQAIYIYMDKGSVFILPKRNFNIEEKEALAHLVRFVPDYKLVVCI